MIEYLSLLQVNIDKRPDEKLQLNNGCCKIMKHEKGKARELISIGSERETAGNKKQT